VIVRSVNELFIIWHTDDNDRADFHRFLTRNIRYPQLKISVIRVLNFNTSTDCLIFFLIPQLPFRVLNTNLHQNV
jgi:hypothetical protein